MQFNAGASREALRRALGKLLGRTRVHGAL
jgi:hypothetical protein